MEAPKLHKIIPARDSKKLLRVITRASGHPTQFTLQKNVSLIRFNCMALPQSRERKISPKFFRPKFFSGRPRGMSVPKCLFFQDLEGLTEVFGQMSAGISGQKIPLWAEFSFLTWITLHAKTCTLFLRHGLKNVVLTKVWPCLWRQLSSNFD